MTTFCPHERFTYSLIEQTSNLFNWIFYSFFFGLSIQTDTQLVGTGRIFIYEIVDLITLSLLIIQGLNLPNKLYS